MDTSSHPSQVLVVEDEAIVALDLKAELEGLGYAVSGIADTADKALELAHGMRPELALVDIRLKGRTDGVELGQALREEFRVPVIYLTSYGDDETVRRAARTAPFGYLTKPYEPRELKAAIDIAIHNANIERQLAASEQRFRNAFDHAPLGMAMVSPTGQYLEMNDAMRRLLGLTGGKACSFLHRDLSVPDELSREQETINELLTGHVGSVQFEKHYRRPSGGTVCTLATVSLLPRNGGPLNYLYQVLDLTAQKQSAQQQAQLEAERTRAMAAELAAQARNEFLSRMSHELRTPLNAIMGFAQLLKLRGVDGVPGAGPYIDHILHAGDHLVALVEDVLDLQRAVTGKLALRIEAVSLQSQVDRAVALLGPMAAEGQVQVDCEVPPGLRVQADEMRLRQVLLNIGSNAVKYNRPGGRVRWVAQATPEGRGRLMVQDTGCGMSAQALSRLFEPFERLGQERSAIPGTGLGMLIARSLTQDMGGTLSVSSTPGVGTTVTLEFDVAVSATKDSGPTQRRSSF